MKESSTSRRGFLKMIGSSLGAFILASCHIKLPNETTPTQESTVTASQTAKPTKTHTRTPTKTLTRTPTATKTPVPCFELLEPIHGIELPTTGRITFIWTKQVGAENYQLEITIPNGYVETYTTNQLRFDKYLASFPLGGEYQWQVYALDKAGNTICTAGAWRFNKPKRLNESVNEVDDEDRQEDDGGGGGFITIDSTAEGDEE